MDYAAWLRQWADGTGDVSNEALHDAWERESQRGLYAAADEIDRLRAELEISERERAYLEDNRNVIAKAHAEAIEAIGILNAKITELEEERGWPPLYNVRA